MSLLDKIAGVALGPAGTAIDTIGDSLHMSDDMKSVFKVLSGDPAAVKDGVDGLRDNFKDGHFDHFQFYGDYGGPNWGDLSKPRPTDPTQAAFYDHDKGYRDHGYFDPGTDIKLMGDLAQLQLDPNLSLPDRVHGAGALAIFGAISPVTWTGRALGLWGG
jgi:hypothetical protein